MRNAFAAEMKRLADADPRIVLLSGDIGNRLFDPFKESFPDRFYNCGVAEANMIGMAAGLAMSGFRPVAYTITPFITTRCLEQIRVDVCYHHVPVTIVAVGAGLSYAGLGPTHHACEDIALLRAMPNMHVVCPGDSIEVTHAVRAAAELGRPSYIRIGKKNEPIVHGSESIDFQIGKALTVRDGSDICLLSTGNLLPLAMETAAQLERAGHKPKVVSFHTVKPLDEELLTEVFTDCTVVATIEEHSLIGGFGAAVAEWLADTPPKRGKLMRIGTRDEFLHESGSQAHARRFFGLEADKISNSIMNQMSAEQRMSA